MSKKKEELMEIMDHTNSTVPLPTHEVKRLVQAEVNKALFDEMTREMKSRGLKIRQVIEFGVKAFVTASKEQKKSAIPKKK